MAIFFALLALFGGLAMFLYGMKLMELGRATNACSNVAQATMLRIKPKIAGREHSYFESMREGENEKYNERYKEEYNRFFSQLDELDDTEYAKKSETSAFNEE